MKDKKWKDMIEKHGELRFFSSMAIKKSHKGQGTSAQELVQRKSNTRLLKRRNGHKQNNYKQINRTTGKQAAHRKNPHK